jgi:anaerobic dimethyl sulfoxide reductase subunit B (iron-sulfur subunit)
MAHYGLLIDYEYCTGCEVCQVTCKEEHDYPVGKFGIRVFDDGPWEIEERRYNFNKIPVPTDLCDLCAERTSTGKEPVCVHHCLANVMSYGTVEELARKLDTKTKQVLWVPQYKPYEARGPFVHDPAKGARKAAHFEVEENVGAERMAAQRGDQRVDEMLTDA